MVGWLFWKDERRLHPRLEPRRVLDLPLAAVAWGFRGRALLEQAGARCIVDTVPELLAVATE